MCATDDARVICPMRSRRNLRLDDLDAAFFADDATVLHPLVLAAVALIVLDGTKYFCAKEPIPFRLEGSVIDGLWLLDFAIGPFPNFFRRRQGNSKRIKRQRILGLLEKAVKIEQFSTP